MQIFMAEELGQNRPNNITRKQIKIKDEEDLISSLPDCLLIEIISRLDSTKEAFKTSTLSKRWQHLWPFVTNLIFKNDDGSLYEFFTFVDRTLSQCHKVKLNKFQLNTRQYDSRLESHMVNKCIRYAISCEVQDLDLSLEWHRKFRYFTDLDELVFINSYFTRLKLSCCCILNPTRVISWNKLTSLCISNGKLDEDSIQNILCGSPLLETLNKCYGFSRIDITSKSVKKLLLSGYTNPEKTLITSIEIEINAPNILCLTIQESLVLRWLMLLDVYSLVETTYRWHLQKKEEDYTIDGIYVIRHPEIAEEDMLKDLMQSLRHVKEIKLGYFCSKVLSRLEAKGFTVPSNIKYHDIFLQQI